MCRKIGSKDVLFKVLYCGVDHSDLHQIGNEIHSATYPLVPRYDSYYCHFMQNNCTTHVVIHGVHEVVGEVLRLAKSYVVNIPDKLSPEQAAPLLCATMFSRHTILSSSLRHSGTLRKATLAGKSYEENGSEIADATEDDVSADQVATLVNYEKSPLQSSSANDESANQSEVHEPFELNTTEVVITNGESRSSESKSKSKTTSDKKAKENGSFVTILDSVRDGFFEDLFRQMTKLDDRSAEASTSDSSSHVNQGNTFVTDSGKIDLATQLRATIAQKQMENDPDQSNGGDILHLTMGVLKEDVIGIDGLAVEFGKLLATQIFILQELSTSNGHSI
ncbi:MAP3K epsilon protein kinase 1-like protein isoform X1 [Tanacetum coccineum]